MLFNNCHTLEELTAKYRFYAKKMHPDMGGNHGDFVQMQNQYNERKHYINANCSQNTLPELFRRGVEYSYHFKVCKFVGIIWNHYYKFEQAFGADILIDIDNISLIFIKRNML